MNVIILFDSDAEKLCMTILLYLLCSPQKTSPALLAFIVFRRRYSATCFCRFCTSCRPPAIPCICRFCTLCSPLRFLGKSITRVELPCSRILSQHQQKIIFWYLYEGVLFFLDSAKDYSNFEFLYTTSSCPYFMSSTIRKTSSFNRIHRHCHH